MNRFDEGALLLLLLLILPLSLYFVSDRSLIDFKDIQLCVFD